MPSVRKGSGVRQGLSTRTSPDHRSPAFCAVVWLLAIVCCCCCWHDADAQVLRRQTSGKWSCVHTHTKDVLLSGSYPNLDYAPIVSPQNKDVCGDRYTPNVECTFSVYGPEDTYIYVEFLNLDLDRDCEQDSVSVVAKRKHRRFCGSSKRLNLFVIDDNTARVNFKSNKEYACRGFSGFMVVFTPAGALKDRRRRAAFTQPELQQEAVKAIGDGKLRQMREQTKVVYNKGTCDICAMTQVADCKCRAPFFESMNKEKGKQKDPMLWVNSRDKPMFHYQFKEKNGRIVLVKTPKTKNKPTSRRTTPTSRRTTPTSRRTTPTSRRTTPTSRRTTPTSRRTTPTSRRTTPTSRRTTPTSRRTTPTGRRTRRTSGTARSYRRAQATRTTRPTSRRPYRRTSAAGRRRRAVRRQYRRRRPGRSTDDDDDEATDSSGDPLLAVTNEWLAQDHRRDNGYSKRSTTLFLPDLVNIDLERPELPDTVESSEDHLGAEQSNLQSLGGIGSLQMKYQAPQADTDVPNGQTVTPQSSDMYSMHLQSRFKRDKKDEEKKECVCRR